MRRAFHCDVEGQSSGLRLLQLCWPLCDESFCDSRLLRLGACSHHSKDMRPFDIVADLPDATSVAKRVDVLRPDAPVHLARIAFMGHGRLNDV